MFSTLAAAERFDAGVAALVHQQRAALSEALPAGVADKRPLAAVHGTVHLQVCCLCEAAAAHIAAESPAARVDELVATQVGRHAEALPAGVTAEGLLSGVDAAVDRQAAPAGETVPALLAGVWPLTCVCPQVSCEAALLAERLPADAAGERPQSSVDGQLVDVDAAACGEAFLTGGTFEGFVLQVDPLVSRQVAVFGELPLTLCTPESVICLLTGQSVPAEAAPRRQRLAAGRTAERLAAVLPAGRLMRPEVAAGAKHLPAVKTPVRPLLVVHAEPMDSDAAAGGESFATGGAAEGPLSAVDPQVSAKVGPSGEAAAADAAAEAPSAVRRRSPLRLAGFTCRCV